MWVAPTLWVGGGLEELGGCEWKTLRVPLCGAISAGALWPIAFRAGRRIIDRKRFCFNGGWVDGWVGAEGAVSGPCNGGSLRLAKSAMVDLAALGVGERLGGATSAVSTPCTVDWPHALSGWWPLGWGWV